MQSDSQRWNLFGLDLDVWVRTWRAGWHELFWGPAVGIRRVLEGPVKLQRTGKPEPESEFFVAEQRVEGGLAEAAADSAYPAWLLPAEKVLVREFAVPDSLEADIEDAVMLEAQSSSPFALDDTCYGWSLRRRAEGKLHITLAVTAYSEVMAFLHAQDVGSVGQDELPEVWCMAEDGHPVVLRGFGEQKRDANYRRRLVVLSALLATCLLMVVALISLPGLVRTMQADNMEYHLRKAEADAAEAVQLREQLVADNSRAQAIQSLVDQQPNVRAVLGRLTTQTPDGVYFEELVMEGGQVRARGWAVNATQFLQLLADDPLYVEVSAPSGIRRHGRTNLEQFTVELRLADAVPAG